LIEFQKLKFKHLFFDAVYSLCVAVKRRSVKEFLNIFLKMYYFFSCQSENTD